MAGRTDEALRLVDFTVGGRPFGVLDLEDGQFLTKVKGTMAVRPGQRTVSYARQPGRYGGQRAVGAREENAEVAWTCAVVAASEDQALSKASDLLAKLADMSGGRAIEFRARGATYPTFLEVRGPGVANPVYDADLLEQQNAFLVELAVPVEPVGRQHRMDVFDDFAVDSLADYTFDSGGGQLSVDTTAKQLVPSVTGIKELRHTARGYPLVDGQWTVKFTTGAGIGAATTDLMFTWLDANNYLMGRIGGGNLELYKRDAGVFTALVTAVQAMSTNTTYWLRVRKEGNVLTAELWTSEPTPMGTPSITPQTHTLSGANATKFGAGISGGFGMRLNPGGTDWRYDDYKVEPFTYKGVTLPAQIPLGGSIPGDAPALVDVDVTHSGGSAAPAWALLGWSERPSVFNHIWNGDFEDDVNGWTLGPVSGIVSPAGTSITRDTGTSKKFGAAGARIATAGVSSGEGAAFALYGKFRKGVTYTGELWARTPTGSPTILVRLGAGGADSVDSAATALTGTHQRVVVTYTPTADREVIHLGVRTNAAFAGSIDIDGVMFYEGTVAPSLTSQAEGRGGLPPFGIIPAESCDPGDLVGYAITADANYRNGQGLKLTAAGAGTNVATWYVDPALLTPDDFTLQEIDVEVYAKVDLASMLVTPKMALSARPEAGTNFGAERFSTPFGSAGKLLVKPSSGNAFRTVRLGVLTMLVDPTRPQRWKLRLTASWAVGSTGTTGVDELYCAVVAKRAAGITGKANDANYPKFVASTGETTKTIRSDLSGLTAKPPAAPFPDSGLGGEPIEFPPGNVDVLVKLASTVPDDPTVDTTSEQKEHSGTLHFSVTPRVNLLRGA